jgi:hypothetical protein
MKSKPKLGFNKITYQDDKILKFLVESKKYGNFEIIIDIEDYEKIKNYRWYISFSKQWDRFREIIANTYLNKKQLLVLHQLIMNDKMVDHKNGNIFDNRKENLRKCTKSENAWNRGKQKNNTSGYKGVYWDKSRNKWLVFIGVNKKYIHIGRFSNIIEAAKAYNEAAIKYHGKFAKLNII